MTPRCVISNISSTKMFWSKTLPVAGVQVILFRELAVEFKAGETCQVPSPSSGRRIHADNKRRRVCATPRARDSR